MTPASPDWTVELSDEQRLAHLVDSVGAVAHGMGDQALLDWLIALLDERCALSRESLSADPYDWTERPRNFRLWRLVEPAAVWKARPPRSSLELFIVRGHGDVLLVAPASAFSQPTPPAQLLGSFFQASRSQPYACADSALSWAMRELGGPEIDLGWREPLSFDRLFRERPERALFDLGFELRPQAADRCLVRLKHVYDLVEDFQDRPLPRHDPIGCGELVALWSRVPEAAGSGRPVVLVLLSIDDEPTTRLLPYLKRAAAGSGYDLVPLFALSRWGSRSVDPAALGEQLEQAWSDAGSRVVGLVVHDGAAFSTSPSAYQTVLGAFRGRHPDVRLATEALLGERGGQVYGITFEQPPELDVVLEQLGF